MRIAVNLRHFIPGVMGGGMETYVRQAIPALHDHLIDIGGSMVVFADPVWVGEIREFAPSAEFLLAPPNGIALGREALAEAEADVLFCPLGFLDPPLPEIPAAVMIADLYPAMAPEEMTPYYRELTRQALRPSARCADLVLTMSPWTGEDMVRRYGVEPERIVITPPAVDDEVATAPDVPAEEFEKLGIPERFLFYPARFYAHKNHTALLEAMALLSDDPEVGGVPVVLSGEEMPPGLVAKVRRLGIEGQVISIGRVDRRLVLGLHRRAEALVFPSRFEGFGIPLVEAMLADTPVLASSQEVVREVVGDAGLIVDESDPASIAAGIRRVLTDQDLRARLRELAPAQAGKFTLEKTSATLIEALDGLAGKERRPDAAVLWEPPTVGVATPSYNSGDFIRDTIDSVLDQDYPHVRYVVMDGGSSDGTVDVLKSYGDRLDWVSQPDGGQADAVNRGIERVGGDIVAFLNADDVYEPGAIATAVERFRERPGAALVYGTAVQLDVDGNEIRTTPMLAADHRSLAAFNPINQPAAFASGDVWREVGGLDASLHLALDYELWMRMSASERPLLEVPDVLARIRFHPDAKSEAQRGRHLRESMEVVRRHYGHVPPAWSDAYARWLAAGRPSVLVALPRTRKSALLQLPLNLYANPRMPIRATRDWAGDIGLLSTFEGRYHDDWIARRWRSIVSVPTATRRVVVRGMHHQLSTQPLGLKVVLDGREVAETVLTDPGKFELEGPITAEMQGLDRELILEASYTTRVDIDTRRLSCQIEEVSFE
jgi:glycosyltransferase involved in cell wall biosynthesis